MQPTDPVSLVAGDLARIAQAVRRASRGDYGTYNAQPGGARSTPAHAATRPTWPVRVTALPTTTTDVTNGPGLYKVRAVELHYNPSSANGVIFGDRDDVSDWWLAPTVGQQFAVGDSLSVIFVEQYLDLPVCFAVSPGAGTNPCTQPFEQYRYRCNPSTNGQLQEMVIRRPPTPSCPWYYCEQKNASPYAKQIISYNGTGDAPATDSVRTIYGPYGTAAEAEAKCGSLSSGGTSPPPPPASPPPPVSPPPPPGGVS